MFRYSRAILFLGGNNNMSATDTLWVLLGIVLVFFMQAGFAILESGLTRAKNAGNIIMKNLMDFMKFNPSTAVQAQIADAMMPYYEQEFDDLVEQGADPMGTALYLSKGTTIPGLENEIFGYNQGGLVPPLRGPMANGVGNLFKLK